MNEWKVGLELWFEERVVVNYDVIVRYETMTIELNYKIDILIHI